MESEMKNILTILVLYYRFSVVGSRKTHGSVFRETTNLQMFKSKLLPVKRNIQILSKKPYTEQEINVFNLEQMNIKYYS